MSLKSLSTPFALAVLVTVANVAKPVTVDDTAYLTFARHIASDPANPYGFKIYWWDKPDFAMDVLCPPVLPYWLALGMTLFGEHIGLLKLWLFPFVFLLAWALNALLFRFARGTEGYMLPLLMLSPAVLPTVNLMLDIPAVALALASVELFIRAATRRDWFLAILAGVVAMMAMQTKYTAFVAPMVMLWYGVTHKRFVYAALAVGACAGAFAALEYWLVLIYDKSHFVLHATNSSSGTLRQLLETKLPLLIPLAGYLGCLAAGVGLVALWVLRVPSRWLVNVAALWCIVFALIAFLPLRDTTIVISVFWTMSGVLWFGAVAVATCAIMFRRRKIYSIRPNRATIFLAGWFIIEIVAALGLTPFPAARRVIGLTLVMGLVATRAVSRIGRVRGDLTPPRWLLAVGIAVGVLVAAIDTLDAYPEKICAQRAAEYTHDRLPRTTVWYVGHWGFQYYCEREGMKPYFPNPSDRYRAGDYIVAPIYPKEDGFHRPYAGSRWERVPEWWKPIHEIVSDDWLSAKTVPNFYGGENPVVGRNHPRLRIGVYRK